MVARLALVLWFLTLTSAHAAPPTRDPSALIEHGWPPAPLAAIPGRPGATGTPLVRKPAPEPPGMPADPIPVLPSPESLRALRELVRRATGPERLDVLLRLAAALDAIAASDPGDATKAKAAASVYRDLVAAPDFARYPRADEALYLYGTQLWRAKREPEARILYVRLLRDYPRSAHVPDVYLAFAEYLFEHDQLAEAKAAYERVRKFPLARGFDFATYKLAWVNVNLGNPQEALAGFVQLARGKDSMIQRAAIKDCLIVYAAIGAGDKAYAFLEQLDRAHALELARALAERYADAGKLDDARKLLQETATRDPDPDRACTDVVGALRATSGLGRRAEIMTGSDRVVAATRKAGSDCSEAADQLLGELALRYHEEAIKLQDVTVMRDVMTLWDRVAQLGTSAPRRATAARNRAIIAWSVARYGSAADWANAAEAMGMPGVDPDVAAAAIDAWDNAIRLLGTPAPTPDRPLASRIRAGLTKLLTDHPAERGAERGADRARALLAKLK